MNEKEDIKFSKYDFNFLIRLKIHEFRKQDIQNIDEQQIKSFLFDYKWKKKKSLPMCEIINDIMSLEFSELFDYLSVQAVKEANTLDLKNFKELISK